MSDIKKNCAEGSNPKAVRLEQETFKQKLIVKRLAEKNKELAKRVAELEAALGELMDKASECDSWESFPEQYLEDARNALKEGE